jgi:hypothetical protein
MLLSNPVGLTANLSANLIRPRIGVVLLKLLVAFLFALGLPLPASARELELGEVVDVVTTYLQGYSKSINGFVFPRIAIGLYGQIARANCSNTHVLGSYYCPKDNTIVLEPIQLESLRRQWGDGSVAYALVHEYAHAVQSQFRISLKDPYHELQADCIAGAVLLSKDTNAKADLAINRADAYEMIATAYSVGGGSVHGSGNQRSDALVQGARAGLSGCGVTLPTQQTVAINPGITDPSIINRSNPSQGTISSFNKWKDQACASLKTNDSNGGKSIAFDWNNPSSYVRRPYIVSTQLGGQTSNIQLLGCLPFSFSVKNPTIVINAPKRYDVKALGVSLCRPGYDIRPVICDRPLRMDLPIYDPVKQSIAIKLLDAVDGKSLFAVTLSSKNPEPGATYQLNMIAGINVTTEPSRPVYGYLGSYIIGFK